MKYLAYFRPNRELSDLILRQNNIILPGSGLHFTLCVFYMEPEQEKNLVNLEAYKNYAFVIEEDVKNLFNRFIEDIKKNSERRKQDFNIPDLLEEKKVKLID